MIKRILTLISAVVLLGLILVPSGCVKEDFDSTPPMENVATWTKTAKIAQVIALYAGNAGIVSTLAAGSLGDSIIIEGTVISSDSASNFYETVTIMDKDSVGIDLKINTSELYLTYGLKPGQKVLVLANNLILDKYNGIYQLGLASTDAGALDLVGINPGDVYKFIQRSGKKVSVEPIDSITIPDILAGKVPIQTLIKLDSVQFWNAYTTYSTPGVNTNRVLIDKNRNQIILRTSGYAKFMNDAVPIGSGSVTAVLSLYGTTYQLYIRDLNDVMFTNESLFEVPTPNKTIAELKTLFTGSTTLISQDIIVEGLIVGNDISGNLYKQLFLADESTGIEIRLNTKYLYQNYPIGTKLLINCKGMYLGSYGGFIQLGGLYNSSFGMLEEVEFAQKSFFTGNATVNPVETSISGINDSMLGKLVKLSSVQFIDSDLGKTYAGTTPTNRTLKDVNGITIVVRTSNYANFASTVLPTKSGSISAVLSKFNGSYQLFIVKVDDVVFNQPRF